MSASFTLRRVLFWTHLFFGLSAGLVIAIMSVTGLALAFEEEIIEWYKSRGLPIPMGGHGDSDVSVSRRIARW